MDEEHKSSATGRHWIPNSERLKCLQLFDEGCGYKKTAAITGINKYTARSYLRRYKSGDTSWVKKKSE